MQYVYVIRNSSNVKTYVGKTKDPIQRKAGHWYCASHGDTRPLYVAMRELGVENFYLDVLEECETEEVAIQREKFWIEHYDSFDSGYNLTSSGGYHIGMRGCRHSTETRRKISEAHKGKIFSEETRRKMSDAKRGVKYPPRTDAQRQKMSEAQKGKILSLETRDKIRRSLTGKRLSEEHRKRIGAAHKGQRRSAETIQKMKAHVFSDEHKRKLSEAAKRRRYERRPSVEKVYKFSEEHRRKLSQAAKLREEKRRQTLQEDT